MQLSIDPNDPIDRVLSVVGALYGVRVVVDPAATPGTTPAPATTPAARRTSAGRAARPRAASSTARQGRGGRAAPATAAVRAWAREHGHEVSDRGPLPASVVAEYVAAT